MPFPKHGRRDPQQAAAASPWASGRPSPLITGFREIARVESAPPKTLGPRLLLGRTRLARKATVTPRIWLAIAVAISAR
jgi:hypothetical protein